MSKRSEQILEIVNQHKKIEVNELANQLKVSKVTIRKDLTELENKGLLRRQHGYAIINSPDNLNFRLAQNYETKLRIAQAAAEQVAENATIMIESGSTCVLLADQLGQQGKHVTIITNSYFIAHYVEKYPAITIILLGGKYQPESEVVVGPLTKMTLANFHVGQLFIGTDGYDAQTGFYSNDLMRVEIVQAMAAQASSVTVLTDSSKFTAPNTVKQLSPDQVTQVITDKGLQKDQAASLRKQHIKLVLV
ncbi:DeoR/GlpR family DNA-binding transcription regulator [Lactobacillus selangorensis]|nr:DeoR/GlpR family DNA-binding transcription regulator [Lactobacillus selangorensis]